MYKTLKTLFPNYNEDTKAWSTHSLCLLLLLVDFYVKNENGYQTILFLDKLGYTRLLIFRLKINLYD